jgi:alkylhydroperoxidase family enzyme
MSRSRGRHPQADRLEGLLAPGPAVRPRIPPAQPRELRPLARTVAELGGRLTGTGPPNLFTTLGRHPRLFRAWLYYSAHLMPFGRLPRRDTELVILRVAWRCESVYEWRQHVPLALRAGLAPETIEAIAGRDPIGGLTHRQRALLAISDDLLARRAMSDRTWGQVGAALTDRDVIEVCLLVGHYQGLASAIGGLAIEPETGPFQGERDHQVRVMTAHLGWPDAPDADAVSDPHAMRRRHMEDTIVTVRFNDVGKAREALRELQRLDGDGRLRVRGAALVQRSGEGRIELSEGARDDQGHILPPAGTAGMLVDVLGGPLGILFARPTEGFRGSAYQPAHEGERELALEDISRNLEPGVTLVVAEIAAADRDVLDPALAALGGSATRRRAQDVYAEIEAAEEATDAAGDEARRILIERLKAQRQRLRTTMADKLR